MFGAGVGYSKLLVSAKLRHSIHNLNQEKAEATFVVVVVVDAVCLQVFSHNPGMVLTGIIFILRAV